MRAFVTGRTGLLGSWPFHRRARPKSAQGGEPFPKFQPLRLTEVRSFAQHGQQFKLLHELLHN